ncbi:MAG: SipW-dependent-type signal peptide-containing protein [Acidimicrobiales bacterium]
MKKNRPWLYLLLAAGLLALGAGGGTFATFNAVTTNPGNTFATGSLYLSDGANATTCFSYNGTNNQNPTGCAAVLTASNVYPGETAASGTVTVANQGTINGSSLYLSAASACADSDVAVTVPSVSLTSGSATASITGNFTTDGVSGNMSVTDSTTGANIPGGTTVLSVSGSTVTLSANAAATATDTLVFTSQTSTAGNPLCGAVLATVQNTTAGSLYCWFGDSTAPHSGACNAPASGQTLTQLTGTSLASPGINLGALAAGSSETFAIGLYLPTSAGNSLMSLKSSFDLTWTLNQ